MTLNPVLFFIFQFSSPVKFIHNEFLLWKAAVLQLYETYESDFKRRHERVKIHHVYHEYAPSLFLLLFVSAYNHYVTKNTIYSIWK